MTLSVNTTIATAQAQLIADALNAGSGPGKLRHYDGTRPTNGGTVTNLIAEQTMSDPCQSSISAGILTFNTITDGLCVQSGTITWARFLDSDLNFVADVSVSDFSPIYATYSISTFDGLMAHFGVNTVSGLLAQLTATDIAKLGDIVISKATFTISEYIRIETATLTVN